MEKNIIFESFSDFAKAFKEGEDVISDPDEKDTEEDKTKEDKIPRLDKEAYILSKTNKTEDELNDLSDEEINAMYDGIFSNEKTEE
jgi:hypothetical protein